MDQEEFFVYAELSRERFEDILDRLMTQFQNIQFGRQGDDWIWVHTRDGRIEIDSFHSMQLELRGTRKHSSAIRRILESVEREWILKRFDPPRKDSTR